MMTSPTARPTFSGVLKAVLRRLRCPDGADAMGANLFTGHDATVFS
jgi:hypothetical protein